MPTFPHFQSAPAHRPTWRTWGSQTRLPTRDQSSFSPSSLFSTILKSPSPSFLYQLNTSALYLPSPGVRDNKLPFPVTPTHLQSCLHLHVQQTLTQPKQASSLLPEPRAVSTIPCGPIGGTPVFDKTQTLLQPPTQKATQWPLRISRPDNIHRWRAG